MKPKITFLALAVVVASLSTAYYVHAKRAAEHHVVRCAVIGGMTMTGLWPEIAKMFEKETGYTVEVVATGERPLLDKAIRAGKVDLLTMHSGDITTDVVADGIGINMQPWTRNELVIVGPERDPAQIRGMTNGAEAFKKIAKARANYVDFFGVGSREMTHTLWRLAGIEPKGEWVLKDDTVSKFNVLQFCRSNNAYVVVGYIPTINGLMAMEGMEVLVKNDPVMRRPYIVMEANPKKFSNVNVEGAHALSEFLVSPKVQTFLVDFGRNSATNRPLFYPVDAARL